MVIVVCAARAASVRIRAPTRQAGSSDTRRSLGMGRLLVSRPRSDTPGKKRLAIAAMFELWSICEDAPRNRVPSERHPLAPSLVRGPHLRGGGGTAAGAGAARRLGDAPAASGRRRARARRGTALVDAEQRLLRQRGDAHRPARLPLGRDAAPGAARPAAGVLPADARGMGSVRALRAAAPAPLPGYGVLRRRPLTPSLLPAGGVSRLDVRLDRHLSPLHH